MNINDLEKEINFILSKYNYIDPYIHYPIEVYSNDYNDIFVFWESNKKINNIKQQNLVKISELIWIINIGHINENVNLENNIDITKSFKATLS